MFSDDPEIPELVTKIAAIQETEMSDKMLSFYNDLMLNYGYFRKACKADEYMKIQVTMHGQNGSIILI